MTWVEKGATIRCKICLLLKRHRARGLCRNCYERIRSRGQIDDFAPLNRTADVVLQDWDELRRQGYSIRHAAERLGMSFKALDKAIERGAKRGDPRAVRQVAA